MALLAGAASCELRAASFQLRASSFQLSDRQLALGVETHKLSEKSMLMVAACSRTRNGLVPRLECCGELYFFLIFFLALDGVCLLWNLRRKRRGGFGLDVREDGF